MIASQDNHENTVWPCTQQDLYLTSFATGKLLQVGKISTRKIKFSFAIL